MNQNEAFPSEWISPDDVRGKEVTLKIDKFFQDGEFQGKPSYALSFQNTKKKLRCNKTNFAIIAEVTGEPDSDNWTGHKITIYTKKELIQGQFKEVIRVKYDQAVDATKHQTASASAPVPTPPSFAPPQQARQPEPIDEGDIPF